MPPSTLTFTGQFLPWGDSCVLPQPPRPSQLCYYRYGVSKLDLRFDSKWIGRAISNCISETLGTCEEDLSKKPPSIILTFFSALSEHSRAVLDEIIDKAHLRAMVDLATFRVREAIMAAFPTLGDCDVSQHWAATENVFHLNFSVRHFKIHHTIYPNKVRAKLWHYNWGTDVAELLSGPNDGLDVTHHVMELDPTVPSDLIGWAAWVKGKIG